MAETKNVTFDSIMRDLRARKYAPIYYLFGEEAYYIDKISDYIEQNVFTPEERDFNLTVLYGTDVSASQVADTARRYPMMAQHQVVIVKEAQNIKQTEPLEKYMKQPQPSTILVLCCKTAKIDGRRREYAKTVRQACVVFESQKLKEFRLPDFITAYLKEHDVSIDAKAAQNIAEAIGSDLNRLTSELDKVRISLPENNRKITAEIVEREIGVSKDFNGFELRDAIVNCNVYKANQIINYFDKNPKAGSVYSLLPLLFNYFQNLMIAYYAPNRTSQESVAQWLGMKSPYAARDYMTGMGNYSGKKVMQIIGKLREIDAKSKGLDNPNTPSGELMKELIFYILH